MLVRWYWTESSVFRTLMANPLGMSSPYLQSPWLLLCPLGLLICCVLPSASPLSLPLAAPSEWAFLYQPRGIHRAGVTKVCVTKKRASSLYSKYKIVIFNAPFQTTLHPQDFLISEPHWEFLIREASLSTVCTPALALTCFLAASPLPFLVLSSF